MGEHTDALFVKGETTMNKVICDICGTSYPESAQECPICGTPQEVVVDEGGMPRLNIPQKEEKAPEKEGFFAHIRNHSEQFQDYEEEEQVGMDHVPRKSNLVLVVAFTVLITLSLFATLFLYIRYYVPGTREEPVIQATLQTTEPEETQTQLTEPPRIPCDSLVLTAGVPPLTRSGQYWLMHVLVSPEDTTDELTFTAVDDQVVTVTQEGRLEAVANGSTTVVIACGDKQILCTVTVDIPEATEPPVTEPVTTETQAEPAAQTSQEETEPSDEASEEPTQETTEVVLKLKQTDLTFSKKGVSTTLELDCDLDPSEVSWLTWNPNVAIVHDGLVTTTGKGTTRIVAQYQGQTVYCIVRCDF